MSVDSETCGSLALVKTFDVTKVPVPSLLRESVDSLGMKHEGVAADAGYKADYWSLVLVGERGIKLDRLGALPLDLQRAFVERWARALGMRFERSDRRAQQAALEAMSAACLALAESIQ